MICRAYLALCRRAQRPAVGAGSPAVQRFVAQRGPRPVPAKAIAYGVEIGAWVAARRADYWAGLLRPDQVAALEQIGGWTWAGPSQRRWEAGLRAVERYVARHAQLPRPERWLDRFHVGSWVQAQRTAHAAGTLPDLLAQRLDAVPGWTWIEEEDRWEVGLAALRAYVAASGAPADLRREVAYQDCPLGHWVQRCREDHQAGSLPPRRSPLWKRSRDGDGAQRSTAGRGS